MSQVAASFREDCPRYWNDFVEGHTIETGEAELTAKAVHDFAEQYDPQPQHLDAEAAHGTVLGGLVASGWQTLAVTMRLVVDAQFLGGLPIIAAEFGRTRFHKPARIGDRIKAEAVVLTTRQMNSRSDRGFLDVEVKTFTTAGELLVTQLWTLVLPCRPASS